MHPAKKLSAPTGKPVNVINNRGSGSRGRFIASDNGSVPTRTPTHKDQLPTSRLPGDDNPWPREN